MGIAHRKNNQNPMPAKPSKPTLQEEDKQVLKVKRFSPLFGRTVAQFQRALRQILPFSEADPDGDHKSLSWARLSRSAGVSRATLGKYLGNEQSANPGLESICRLAEELSIPPAFLLMTADDWTRVFTAVHTYQNSLQGRKQFHDYVAKTVGNEDYPCKPVEIIRDAQAIASMTDVGRAAVRQSASIIANVSLALPLRDFSPEMRALALVVASVVATSSPKSRFLSDEEAQCKAENKNTEARGMNSGSKNV